MTINSPEEENTQPGFFVMMYVPSFFSSQEMKFEPQIAGMKQNYFQIVPFYTVVLTYVDGAKM